MLDDVFLGELVVVDRGDELLEFRERLAAEVAAIDEEEDAAGAAVADEAVERGDSGEGLEIGRAHV